ncbi:MAG: S8 family serine peptidase [Verrucomicrobiales bacterium]
MWVIERQLDHPDLYSNIINLDPLNPNTDGDLNGYLNDWAGWDFRDGDNDPSPSGLSDNHGTLCAGVAVAVGNNNEGGLGIAYGAKLMSVRIAQAQPTTNNPSAWSMVAAQLAAGIEYAAGQTTTNGIVKGGADVISMSFSTSETIVVSNALAFATSQGRVRNGVAKGAVLFAATGNQGSGWVTSLYQITNTATIGNYQFTWEYSKNPNTNSGDDAVWLDEVVIADLPAEGFQTGAGLPTGWTTSGNANWVRVQDGVTGNHAMTGVNGETNSFSVKSGGITHSQQTTIQYSKALTSSPASQYVTFSHWISSEPLNDKLTFSIIGPTSTQIFNVGSGIPVVVNMIAYPARDTNVIAVGGVTRNGFRADYSQYNPTNNARTVDIVAPTALAGLSGLFSTDRTGTNGVNTTTYYNGNYAFMTGTSASTPLAAGIGALVLSFKQELTASEVKIRLTETAIKVGGLPYLNGFNTAYGFGRVDAHRAVAQGAVESDYTGVGTGPNSIGSVTIVKEHSLSRNPGILIGGSFTNYNGTSRPYLARISRSDGSLLTSFAPVIPDSVTALDIQADGKVIVAANNPSLRRLNTDGTTDGSFIATLDGQAYAVKIDADGDIVISGSFQHVNGIYRPFLARLSPTGSIRTNFNPVVNNYPFSLICQDSGLARRIIIGGQFTTVGGITRNRFARVNFDGSCDTLFATGTGANGTIWTMTEQTDGKILIGGDFTSFDGSSRGRFARTDASGLLDSSFAIGAGANSTVRSINSDLDTQIMISGSFTSYNGLASPRMVRLFSDGSKDPYFDLGAGPNAPVNSFIFISDYIVAGGDWTTFNGVSQAKVMRIQGK